MALALAQRRWDNGATQRRRNHVASQNAIVGGGPKKVLYTLATITRMGLGRPPRR